MRFIFSVKKELKYIDMIFEGKATLSKKEVEEVGSLYGNVLAVMKKLMRTEMFEQIQEELGSAIGGFCSHLERIMKLQGVKKQLDELARSIYEILKMICRNYKDNQNTAYYFLQCFVKDVFADLGAEELLSELFLNNYSLLCKVPKGLQ